MAKGHHKDVKGEICLSFVDNLSHPHFTDFRAFVKCACEGLTTTTKRRGNHLITVYDTPCSFDIETTNTYVDDVKFATMWVWQFGLNGYTVIGRTWDEYAQLIDMIADALHLNDERLLYVYVFNLNFEFQYIRKRFRWSDVFATSDHSVLFATSERGVSYRDCAILCGCNLAMAANNLTKYVMPKMVGDLDYSLIRNSKSQITDKEMGYILNDVKSVMCIIQEKIEQSGSIAKIPLTNTGYVRNALREAVMSNKDDYHQIQRMTMTTDDYTMSRTAFCGGFTHGSANWVGLIADGKSYDKTSAYSTQMLEHMYPMGSGEWMPCSTQKEYEYYNKLWGTIAEITFVNISPRVDYDHILSYSHCTFRGFGDVVVDNGRVVSAPQLTTTITNVDYKNIKRFYKWDRMVINCNRVLCYKMDYLPKTYIDCVLDFYKKKTTLKGVAGKEADYQLSKGMLNSLYGMICEDPVRDQILYEDDEYVTQPVNLRDAIDKYNKNRRRVSYYPWAVWVTAYQRECIWDAIYDELKDDYIYSDTDSLKYYYLDDDHTEYFKRCDGIVTQHLNDTMDHYGIDREELRPVNIKGKVCPLGTWDDEGEFRIKVLGAKRYMTEHDGDISITIAGLGKKTGGDYIRKQSNPFKFFRDGMYIPPDSTGKLTHTYVDSDLTAYIVDYTGIGCEQSEMSYTHLESCPFELGVSEEFANFLEMIYDQNFKNKAILK